MPKAEEGFRDGNATLEIAGDEGGAEMHEHGHADQVFRLLVSSEFHQQAREKYAISRIDTV
jgi:hypothetical protein